MSGNDYPPLNTSYLFTMLEIPESKTIGLQAEKVLTGKKITEVFNATKPHKFAFFNGDPSKYGNLLEGRQVSSANGHGMFVDLALDENISFTIGEGTNMRYYLPSEVPPDKYQLLIVLDDGSFISFNVAMYGIIWAYSGIFDNKYHKASLDSLSPLEDKFDEAFFDGILSKFTKGYFSKGFACN